MAVQRLSNSGRSGFSYKSLIAGITPLPSVPTIGAATAVSFQSVNVAFTAPGAYAGSTYTATSSPGGLIGTSATSPILVSGLSELTEYTFTVTATNATGTSGASAASSPVTTPSGDTGVMFPIQMVSVGAAGTSEIEFTSIPSTYTHLQIRFISRIDRSGENADFPSFRFNNDTASNYSWHALEGSGVSAFAESSANASVPRNGEVSATTATAGIFGAGVVDILDYKNTSKYKSVRSLVGVDRNGSGTVWFGSSSWRNTSTITNIKITPVVGTGFQQYTQFALYGIKGA